MNAQTSIFSPRNSETPRRGFVADGSEDKSKRYSAAISTESGLLSLRLPDSRGIKYSSSRKSDMDLTEEVICSVPDLYGTAAVTASLDSSFIKIFKAASVVYPGKTTGFDEKTEATFRFSLSSFEYGL
ncbi:hypothetical protein Leryth_022009 [Lithospermum erythrorhizon]|nr:hypothetical protein Leryth_022009 [Lithospermum erythrorhizon]